MTLRLRTPDEIERTDPLRARYVRMLIHAATTGEPERSSPMDAGLALGDALAGRPTQRRSSQRAATEARDAAGHQRMFYPGLLAHAHFLRRRVRGDSCDAALRTHRARVWAETDTYNYHSMHKRDHRPSAEVASLVAADAWNDLASVVAGAKPDTLRNLVTVARDGDPAVTTFFNFDHAAAENPETWWYHELVVLHAVATYAAMTGDRDAGEAARRAAAFHHAETQPDHATNQPWAIHAFLSDPEFTPTADFMLLAAGVNQPGSLDAVSRILLADAAVCLSLPESA